MHVGKLDTMHVSVIWLSSVSAMQVHNIKGGTARFPYPPMSRDLREPNTSNNGHLGMPKQHTQVLRIELLNGVKQGCPTHHLRPQEAEFT